VLADTGAAIERVAAQLVAAPPGGRPEVVETLREAARRALSDGAPESASAYLRRALAEPPPAADRAGVLLEHKTKVRTTSKRPQLSARSHLPSAGSATSPEPRAALLRGS
jgi:hypothetical protein